MKRLIVAAACLAGCGGSGELGSQLADVLASDAGVDAPVEGGGEVVYCVGAVPLQYRHETEDSPVYTPDCSLMTDHPYVWIVAADAATPGSPGYTSPGRCVSKPVTGFKGCIAYDAGFVCCPTGQ